ncbi:ATP-binding protein [Pyrococcus kukulkanii]|uniref:AAA family ATPase n=1 Tax=Pyrococcus kukulkanii TaxID=1609559 RepID=UPI0035658463
MSMFFKVRPITKIEELHGEGHRRVVKLLKENVEAGIFTALLGPRRVGKTSILRVFLNEYDYKFLYYDLSPFIGRFGVSYLELTPAIINVDPKDLSYRAQLSLGIVRLDVKPESSIRFQNELINLLRELNSKYENVLLVIDEAQVMPRIRGLNMLGVLQLISNTLDNVTVIMTGSMPGLLEKVLNPSASQPMFSRYVDKIHVERWTLEESVEYLKRGFKEEGVPFSEPELEEAAEELSNVPGFLAYYGIARVRGLSHEKALEEASEHAVRVWEKDLEAFLTVYNSRAYVTILSLIASSKFGISRREILNEVRRREDISERSVTRILHNLVMSGMVVRRSGKYFIPERPLAKAILRVAGRHRS